MQLLAQFGSEDDSILLVIMLAFGFMIVLAIAAFIGAIIYFFKRIEYNSKRFNEGIPTNEEYIADLRSKAKLREDRNF